MIEPSPQQSCGPRVKTSVLLSFTFICFVLFQGLCFFFGMKELWLGWSLGFLG